MSFKGQLFNIRRMYYLKCWFGGSLDYVKIQRRLVMTWLWTSADYFLIHGNEVVLSQRRRASELVPSGTIVGRPRGGQGQGSHHWAPSLRPGEETLVHHCKEACYPVHVAPKWTVPGHLSSGVNCLPCSQTQAHTSIRRINAFCLSFVW